MSVLEVRNSFIKKRMTGKLGTLCLLYSVGTGHTS